jgi:putative photosynthetic complex assembly protein 2
MTLSLAAWAQLYLYPLLVTLAVWGGLTMGLIWLNQRGARAGRWALLLFLPLLLLAHQQLWDVRHDLSALACYRAFLAGMAIWAWHELAFYCGVLSGPWRVACPPGLSPWKRFGYALGTHVYHEAAVVIEFALLWHLHTGATNTIGAATFVALWALQHSAKLNVFLGVRNLKLSVFPEHIRYLGSFWAHRPHNPFFFVSMLGFGLLAAALWMQASALAPAESTVGLSLLATVLTLGVLEHWLLILPLAATQPAAPPLVKPAQPPDSHPWPPDH